MKTNKLLKITLASFIVTFGTTFTSCSDDECTESTWFADTDNDGLGDPNSTLNSCDEPEGYVLNDDDTDDTVAFCEVLTWYQDIDEDGLGNPDISTEACEQPEGYVSNSDDDLDTLFALTSKYTVSAELLDDGEGYYTTTGNLLSESISIVGEGYEGFANLSVSLDGYFYDINDVETTIDKYEFTNEGLVKVDAISYGALFPGTFFRFMQYTGTGDLLIANQPRGGELPYIIIDLEGFTLEKSGNLTLPEVDGLSAAWAQPIVKDDEIYFGAQYGWANLPNKLITIKYDYPSLENPVEISTDKSSGSVAGYRGNGFKTENGDIYQHNLTSRHWYEWDAESDELANAPSVLVRIRDGEYDDDFVIDVSAQYDEKITIWNVWYAGNDIAYANIIKESDVSVWGDLSTNIGTIAEINLATGAIQELNIPSAPYVNIFKAECIDDGKFYLPVSISGGAANIYEINIGGGANAFQKGATLDGSNVYINAIYRNF